MTPADKIIHIDDTSVFARLTFGNESMEVWDLFTMFLHQKVGQLVLHSRMWDDKQYWTVVNTYVTVRGIGLMRRFIRKLGYPRMTSCFAGATSEDCYRMWRGLGAQKVDTNWCPVGFVYVLKQ